LLRYEPSSLISLPLRLAAPKINPKKKNQPDNVHEVSVPDSSNNKGVTRTSH